MDTMPAFLNHVAIPFSVESDPVNFYTRILGFTEKYRFTLDNETAWKIFGVYMELPVIVMVKDELKIELFKVPFTENHSISHLCLFYKDIDAVCRRAEKSGFRVVKTRRDSGEVAFIRDSSNNIFELKRIQSGDQTNSQQYS